MTVSSALENHYNHTAQEEEIMVENKELYASFWATFLKYTKERDVEEIRRYTTALGNAGHFSKPNLRILSLGCGGGRADMELIKTMMPFLPPSAQVEYDAVEFNYVLFKQFAAKVEALPSYSATINVVQIPSSVEEYIVAHTTKTEKVQYDLVFICHSFYYCKDKRRTLEVAFDALAPNGKIALIHQGPAGINQLQKVFGKKYNPTMEKVQLNYVDIEEMLLQIRHETGRNVKITTTLFEGFIDVTKCLIPGDKEGRELLSFFVETSLMDKKESEIKELVDFVAVNAIRKYDYSTNHESWNMFHPTALINIEHDHKMQ